MSFFADFHTHSRQPEPGCLKLVSSRDAFERGTGVFWSLELHPWKLPEIYRGLPESFVRQAMEADALGEAGLDTLKGPSLAVQRQYLHALLALASDCGKPVVFHVVRAFPELLKEVRFFGKIPKLLHGFRGNDARREELQKAGFLLSGAFDSRNDGLETDTLSCSVKDIYEKLHIADSAKYEETFHRFLSK